MGRYCHACTIPLESPEVKGPSDNHCKFCTDAQGELLPRQQVQQGIASWMAEWQGIDRERALRRADLFMRGLPAWADD